MLSNFEKMIVGLAEIIDGLTVILTFGSYHPLLAFKATAHFTMRNT